MPDGIRPGRIRRSWTGWGESSGFRDCPRVASEGAGPKEDARCKGPQPLGTPGRYFRGRAVAGDRCLNSHLSRRFITSCKTSNPPRRPRQRHQFDRLRLRPRRITAKAVSRGLLA